MPRHRAGALRRAAPVRRSGNGYTLPSLNLLAAPRTSERTTLSRDIIDGNAVALESVLRDFGVRGEIINARPGPVVTLYELEPAPGIKSSRVIGLADDIARSMSAVSARVAVVSGPQRYRHRIAQSDARESLFARAAHRHGLQRERSQIAALPRQDDRRRIGHRRSCRACRIC